MPTIRVSMKCCPIAGLPITPSRSCRIASTNLVRRRLASASDGNDDARCCGQSNVRAHPHSSWIASARALQFKKQYVLAGRLHPPGVTESLDDGNWIGSFAGLSPNSGSQFLESDNGNLSQDFLNLGISKNLGGAIQNHPYLFSFYIAKNLELQPVEFADFSTLRIGGPAGAMLWTSTPTPVNNAQWYEWTGTYTPSISDLGNPFVFTAIFDLDARHSIAIDGPIAVPEPAALLLALFPIVGWLFNRWSVR